MGQLAVAHSRLRRLAALLAVMALFVAGCKSSRPEVDLAPMAGSDPASLARSFGESLVSNRNREVWWFAHEWKLARVEQLPPGPTPPDGQVSTALEYSVVMMRQSGDSGSKIETDVVFVGVVPTPSPGRWKVASWGMAP